jgi:arsenate reductase
MAEALLRTHGGGDFEVFSAGTEPKGLNARTMQLLDEVGIDGSFARSKSVDEFAGQSFDFVITVCDQARQVCPVFPGGGQTLHWGYPDPAEATGTEDEVMAVYRKTFTAIGERIGLFIPLALRHRDEAAASTVG